MHQNTHTCNPACSLAHSRTGEGSRDTEGDGDSVLGTPVAQPSEPPISSSLLAQLAAAEKGEGLREDVSASWAGTLRCRLPLRLRGDCWVLCRASRLPATTGEQHSMQTTCTHASQPPSPETNAGPNAARVRTYVRTTHAFQELSVPVRVGAVVARHFFLQCLDERLEGVSRLLEQPYEMTELQVAPFERVQEDHLHACMPVKVQGRSSAALSHARATRACWLLALSRLSPSVALAGPGAGRSLPAAGRTSSPAGAEQRGRYCLCNSTCLLPPASYGVELWTETPRRNHFYLQSGVLVWSYKYS